MPKKFAASEGRRSALNMKTTADLRARLEAAAAKSGRALTHEVEHRIEMSFLEDELREYKELKEGDAATRELGECLKLVIGILNKRFGENWKTSEAARNSVQFAISTVLDRMFARFPLDEAAASDAEQIKAMQVTAGFVAKTMVGMVTHDPAIEEFWAMTTELHNNPDLMAEFEKSLKD